MTPRTIDQKVAELVERWRAGDHALCESVCNVRELDDEDLLELAFAETMLASEYGVSLPENAATRLPRIAKELTDRMQFVEVLARSEPPGGVLAVETVRDDDEQTLVWESVEVAELLRLVSAGNETAATEFWRRYFDTVVDAVRPLMERGPNVSSSVDAEDIAVEVFADVFSGEQIRRLIGASHDEILAALIVMARTTLATHQRLYAKKTRAAHIKAAPIDSDIVGRSDTPEQIVIATEERDRLSGLFGHDEILMKMFTLRLEGYSYAHIAREVGVTERSVERKFKLIRSVVIADARVRLESALDPSVN